MMISAAQHVWGVELIVFMDHERGGVHYSAHNLVDNSMLPLSTTTILTISAPAFYFGNDREDTKKRFLFQADATAYVTLVPETEETEMRIGTATNIMITEETFFFTFYHSWRYAMVRFPYSD